MQEITQRVMQAGRGVPGRHGAAPRCSWTPTGREMWRLGNCAVCARLPGSPSRDSLCREHRRTRDRGILPLGRAVHLRLPLRPRDIRRSPLRRPAALRRSHQRLFDLPADGARHAGRGGSTAIRRPHQVFARIWAAAPVSASASCPPRACVAARILLFDLAAAYGMNDAEQIAESREKSIQQFTIANYLDEARDGKGDLLTSLASMQNEIIDKVVLGDLSGSREIINRFLGVIFLESGMNFDMLKVRLLELIVIISRAAMGKGISADGLLGPRYSYLTDINAASELRRPVLEGHQGAGELHARDLRGAGPHGARAHDADEGFPLATIRRQRCPRGRSPSRGAERQPGAPPLPTGNGDDPFRVHRVATHRLRALSVDATRIAAWRISPRSAGFSTRAISRRPSARWKGMPPLRYRRTATRAGRLSRL